MEALNQTDQYLMGLSLKGMRETLSRRIQEALDSDLGYEEFLNLILFDENQYRQNARRTRLLRAAGFKTQASLEGVSNLRQSRRLEYVNRSKRFGQLTLAVLTTT